MASAVKTENRLPASYRLRLLEARISRQAIAEASPAFHLEGKRVSHQFVTGCLTRRDACPAWLRAQLDTMLEETGR